MDASFHEISQGNNFMCEDCGMKFLSRSGLRRHRLRKHKMDEKKYKCTSCDASYCELKELEAHQTTKHKIPKPYNVTNVKPFSPIKKI